MHIVLFSSKFYSSNNGILHYIVKTMKGISLGFCLFAHHTNSSSRGLYSTVTSDLFKPANRPLAFSPQNMRSAKTQFK